MGRAPCCEKVGLKKGRWTAEEDDILKNYILSHGEGSWRSLPKNAGLLRCGKSCRLRWINYLRSDVKRGNITPEEQELIVNLHSTLGNRWSLIASQLAGRTDNEIKNYWNSHLSRKIHYFQKQPMRNDERNTTMMIETAVQPHHPPRGGRGRTSRANMKKNKHPTRIINKDGSSSSNKNNNIDMNNNNNNNNRVNTMDPRKGRDKSSCNYHDHDHDEAAVCPGEGVVVEDHCRPMSFDDDVMDPHGVLTSLTKEKTTSMMDQESCSNAGESSYYANYFDDPDQVWMSAGESFEGEKQQELMSWLMWGTDGPCSEGAQSAKEQEAMLAWLLS